MGLKCKVSYTDNNEAIVQDDFGRESVLYRGLLQVLGNQEAALTAWATAHTRDMNFIGESARPVDVIRFMDSYQAEISRPNEAEKFQIRDFQQKNGFHRLSDLYAEMVQIFKPNGYFEVDVQRAIESGMYTKENIEELDVQMVSDILSKIEGQLLVEDIYTVPDTLEDTYENDTEKTVFGTSRRYSEQDVFDSIRQTVSNPRYENGFYKEIGNTGFTKLEDRLKSDPKFAREFIDRMSVPQSVNTLRVDVDGNVVVGSNNTYDTVKNTVLRGTSTLELQADMDFIEGIEDNFWAVSLDKVQEVVRDIEGGLIKNNLDIIGLSTRTSDKAEILQVLEASLQLLENPNDTNVANFSELKDRIFGTEQINEIHNIPENFENRTTFYLDTEKGAAELFNDYGLIKIADNIYHKVDQNADVDLAIDIIAKSDLVIPKSNRTEGVSENKVDRVQDVTSYVMSTSPRSLEGINNPLLYAAYLNHFGHQPLEISKSDIANLSDIKTSTEYLEDQFVVDFYNEYLKHKFENSQEYQSTLSKFRFTNSDIIINSRISGIENLPMQQELADYIRLRNNESMKYLVEQTAEVNEDLAMINDPSSISEYQGPISVRGNYAFVNNNLSDNFVKVDGEVYRKVLAEENTSLFLKVIPNSSETYLDASTNFKHDKAEAQKMMDAYKTSSKTTVGSTEYKSKISKARTAKVRSAKLRELSTLKSPDYSFTVEGDGIIAYKDSKQVSRLTLGDYKKGKQVQDFEINQWDRGKGLETEMYLLMLDNFKRDTIYLGQTEFTAERYIAETLELPKVGTDFVYNSNEQSQVITETQSADIRYQDIGEQGARNLDQVSKAFKVVTDLSGNQTEVDSSSIVTYETEAGPIHYIVDSNGDMQMVRLGEQAVPEAMAVDLLREEELVQESAVEKTATIFHNAIEVVPLYSTKDINTIEQEIDSCG